MAEPRAVKVARLARLRSRLPYVSQNALVAILKIAVEEPLPTGTRKDVREARDSVVLQQTPYGPLHRQLEVQPVAGSSLNLEIQSPQAILYHAASVSASLSGLLRRAAVAKPPGFGNPWRLILYGDEITPGNQLAYKNERKAWGIYWSLLEFGSAALSHEDRNLYQQ